MPQAKAHFLIPRPAEFVCILSISYSPPSYKILFSVHKLENNFAYGAGLRYEFETSADRNRTLSAEASADYYIDDNMSIGGVLDYRIVGDEEPKLNSQYSAEARFKILF